MDLANGSTASFGRVPKVFGPLRKPAHGGAATRKEVVEMTDFLARNWVSILFIGGMAFMHFGMHRGHGKSGHNESHEAEASTLQGSDTGPRAHGSRAEGAVDLSDRSPQDRLAPSQVSVQTEDAPPVKGRRGGCC